MNEKNEISSTPFFEGYFATSKIQNNSMLFKISPKNLDFSVRFKHVLLQKEDEIKSIGDLLNTEYEKILMLKNCGIKSIQHARKTILEFLDNYKPEEDPSTYKNEETIDAIKSFPLLNVFTLPLTLDYKKLDKPIRVLNLPKRFFKIIKQNRNIVTIKDLLDLEPELLLEKINLGKITIEKVQREILSYLEADDNNVEGNKNNPIIIINKCLERLPNRNVEICLERWSTRQVASLESIGNKYGLTRERIRQIIEAVVKNVKSNFRYTLTNVRSALLDSLIKNPKPVGEAFLKTFTKNFKYRRSFYIGIMSELFPEAPFHGFIPKSFDQILAKKTQKNILYKKLIDLIEKLSNNYKSITSEDLNEILVARNYNLSERLLCFKVIIGSNRYFFIKDKGRYYLGKKVGIRELAYSILFGSQCPLKIEEIISTIRKDFFVGQKYDSITSVIGNIKQDERIFQLDRYLFGIEKHISYPKEVWPRIIDRAINFLEQKRKQTYATEILNDLQDDFPLLRSKYELVIILRNTPEIVDLGFFNFTLASFGQEERIKVNDLIHDLYRKDPQAKHISEIKEKLKESRYIHDSGLSALLKNQKYLKTYLAGYYGLKSLEEENNRKIAGEKRFILYLINQFFFPNTKINIVAEFFDSEELQQKVIATVTSSDLFQIYTLENGVTCIINKEWSVLKKTKCLLYNIKEDVFEEQLRWMLKDVGVEDLKKDLYKIRNDRAIRFSHNRYTFIDSSIITPEIISIIDECYELINDSTKTYSLRELFDLIDSMKCEIDYSQFVYTIKEDDRFMIMDNKWVLVK